jgi:hypothetical protein
MKKILYYLIVLLIIIAEPVSGQNDTIDIPLISADSLKQNFAFFNSDEILNLSLRFDISTYRSKKPKDEYLDAVLTYHINEHDSINKNVKLKSRGDMRNDYCDFPPIRLNFKKTDSINSDLSKIDKLKMVTHCKTGNEDYLFREFLIYKLYNVLTDNSFRVRLVKVDYINTAKKSKPIETYAFLIEPIEFLAKRIKSVPVNTANLTQKYIIPEIMDRMAIFNFMIGNTDWSVPILHNCIALSGLNINNPGLGIIVPYDFDYSGLVNADYAIPFDGLGLKTVRERRYLGVCRSEDVFINALKEFTDKKEEFYRVINDFPLLSAKTKKDVIGYLDTFYSEFDKRNSIVFDLLSGCIKF